MRQMNLPVAAFISSRQPGAFGPWNVNEGLCTLEMHRDLPIDLQARHLFATGLVDDVLIANCFHPRRNWNPWRKSTRAC